MIVSTIYKYFHAIHTGRSSACIVQFWNYFIEKRKKHDKWLKNSHGTIFFLAVATHFDLIHQIRFLKQYAEKIENKNEMGRNENEAASLFSLLRKTNCPAQCMRNHGPVLIEIENMT